METIKQLRLTDPIPGTGGSYKEPSHAHYRSDDYEKHDFDSIPYHHDNVNRKYCY